MSAAPPQLKDFSPVTLRERFVAEGLPGWRADQVASWVYARGVEDPDAWTDLPQELRASLAERYALRALTVRSHERSRDGTVKAALATHDGAVLEAVLI
ncbi:MAG: hypothetical protein ABFS41_01845, partial [Myxococcota bacterium]